ncbi:MULTISPECIES: hypothetical protein [Nocardia]|uniref:hypothetical protein n=1 Tax=Nocardia TaxID=1817 RepID=UPI0007EA7284|nr:MULTISPECIES: hypothetical protein [Nocardia]MBF6278415.1 hypothetical protein [Nocardia nova]OBA50500.1 hypothetical protein A5789_29025 [Nocardia sp. 852002-51101_SCH5132738]OBB33863.1 hypothetical protein A5748_07580 [Nocardia sp. 852002-51244_SCH5132740]OBF69656.1 hypothetical protein A9X06_32295 [Mycobacterium sp. 852002-51759_SCH5129042]
MAIVADQVDEATTVETEEADVGCDSETAERTAGTAAEDDVAPSGTATDGETTARPRGSYWRAWLIGGLVAAVAVLTSISVRLGLDVRSEYQSDARNQAILETARRVAVQLVSLNYNTAKQDLDAITASSTGSFRSQFEKLAGTFTGVLDGGKVESTGEVKAIGIVTADDDTATVLTAITSIVKNTEAPEGQQRAYRMKMTLDNFDGNWLVSNVEFTA